ncbi:MAG: hypothetical protein DME15_21115 [Candidatus Rokuibacteriota bacterium]|nr:MAG: hypothetical protein DME15_21115 [Candidatus Rokubacteria bacterium]
MKPWVFHLGYGALCLDFANTVSWRGSGASVDHLQAYDDLIRFALQAKLVSAVDARRLGREARRPASLTGRPGDAQRRPAGGARPALRRPRARPVRLGVGWRLRGA